MTYIGETTSKQIIERIVKLMTITSKDETRLKLQGVHITTYRDTITLEATDGHRAVRETYTLDIEDDVGLETLALMDDKVILRQQVEALKVALKDYKGAITIPIDVDGDFLHIGYGIKVLLHNNMDYPNLTPILKDVGGPFKLGLDAKYLYELLKVMKDSGTHDGVVIEFDMRLEKDKDGNVIGNEQITKPLVINRDMHESVLMPRRV